MPEEGSDDGVIKVDHRTRTVLLAVVGAIAALSLLGDSFGGWEFPWPLAIVGLVIAAIAAASPSEAAPRSAARARLDPARHPRRDAGRPDRLRSGVPRLPAGPHAAAGRHPPPRADPVLVHGGARDGRPRPRRHLRPGRVGCADLGVSRGRARLVRRDAAGRCVLRARRRSDLRRAARRAGDAGSDRGPGHRRLHRSDRRQADDCGSRRGQVRARCRRDHPRPDGPERERARRSWTATPSRPRCSSGTSWCWCRRRGSTSRSRATSRGPARACSSASVKTGRWTGRTATPIPSPNLTLKLEVLLGQIEVKTMEAA